MGYLLYAIWQKIKSVFIAGGLFKKNSSSVSFTNKESRLEKLFVSIAETKTGLNMVNNQDSPIIAPPTIMPKPLLLENKPIMPLTVVKPILAPDKKLAFIKSLRIAVAEGFEPLIPFTQCYHETANFRRLVGEWNYAGMKIPRKAVPPVLIKPIEVWTHEVINGVSRLVKDTFADFNSADDFMLFYIWQIKRLYPVSYENRNNSQQFFRWLTHGVNKWATDNSYSAKLEKLYSDLRANGVYAQMLEVLKNLL